MIKSVRQMEQELVSKVLKMGLGVKDLEYIEYKNGSMIFRGIDKQEGIKTVVKLDTYTFSLYQKWENAPSLWFHVNKLI